MQLPYLEPGSTALHIACQRVHLRCIRLLTSAGADRSVLDDRGFTPIDVLHEFPSSGEDDIGVSEEDAKGDDDAEREPAEWETPPVGDFRSVVVVPPSSTVQEDLKAAIKKAAADGAGTRPQPPQPQRIASADTRLLEAIGWLKKEGAGNFMTGSALHTAVTTGCLKVVETLLSVDPDSAYAPNAKGETPVHAAIEARNIEALRLLVST